MGQTESSSSKPTSNTEISEITKELSSHNTHSILKSQGFKSNLLKKICNRNKTVKKSNVGKHLKTNQMLLVSSKLASDICSQVVYKNNDLMSTTFGIDIFNQEDLACLDDNLELGSSDFSIGVKRNITHWVTDDDNSSRNNIRPLDKALNELFRYESDLSFENEEGSYFDHHVSLCELGECYEQKYRTSIQQEQRRSSVKEKKSLFRQERESEKHRSSISDLKQNASPEKTSITKQDVHRELINELDNMRVFNKPKAKAVEITLSRVVTKSKIRGKKSIETYQVHYTHNYPINQTITKSPSPIPNEENDPAISIRDSDVGHRNSFKGSPYINTETTTKSKFNFQPSFLFDYKASDHNFSRDFSAGYKTRSRNNKTIFVSSVSEDLQKGDIDRSRQNSYTQGTQEYPSRQSPSIDKNTTIKVKPEHPINYVDIVKRRSIIENELHNSTLNHSTVTTNSKAHKIENNFGRMINKLNHSKEKKYEVIAAKGETKHVTQHHFGKTIIKEDATTSKKPKQTKKVPVTKLAIPDKYAPEDKKSVKSALKLKLAALKSLKTGFTNTDTKENNFETDSIKVKPKVKNEEDKEESISDKIYVRPNSQAEKKDKHVIAFNKNEKENGGPQKESSKAIIESERPVSRNSRDSPKDIYHMKKSSFGDFLDTIVNYNATRESEPRESEQQQKEENEEYLPNEKLLHEFNPRPSTDSERVLGEKFSFQNPIVSHSYHNSTENNKKTQQDVTEDNFGKSPISFIKPKVIKHVNQDLEENHLERVKEEDVDSYHKSSGKEIYNSQMHNNLNFFEEEESVFSIGSHSFHYNTEKSTVAESNRPQGELKAKEGKNVYVKKRIGAHKI